MKRRIKRHYMGWIVAGGIGLIWWVLPLDIFIRLFYEAKVKAEITEDFLLTLTGTAKAGGLLLVAATALVYHKVVKK